MIERECVFMIERQREKERENDIRREGGEGEGAREIQFTVCSVDIA